MEEQQEPTILDIFAGLALIGLLAHAGKGTPTRIIVEGAYDVAEAMLEESKKRNTKE